MSFAPQQNWPAFHSLVEPRQVANDRQLSAAEKFERYGALYDLVLSLRQKQSKRAINSADDEELLRRADVLNAFRNVTGPCCG